MLRIAMYTTIETLWKQGRSKSEIARATGHDWKTVAKVIKELKNHKTYPVKKPHPTKLDAYKDNNIEWLEHNYPATKIHESLQLMGVKACYSSVKRYIKTMKKKEDTCIRFHSAAGEEAQVDFGYVGLTVDNEGKKRKTWIFNMRLSYSRLDFYMKVYDQKVETFINCHLKAFHYFQGVPKSIKIDNLKAAILEANFYEPIYQQLYKQFADYYQFQPIPCRIYQPQEKGKTESAIKYIKRNFFIGKNFISADDLDKQLCHWLNTICNKRIHGTTRKIPQELFEQQEKMQLIKLPEKAFYLPKVGERQVYRDCHIYVDYNYYSVPYKYVGKMVEIEISDKFVKINYQGEQIAIHPKCEKRGEFVTCISHYPSYKNCLSTDYQSEYHLKMQKIGEHAGKLFLLILAKHPNDWYRTTKGIIDLTKHFTAEIVNLACKRAVAYGVAQYRIIKSICENGSYQIPVEEGIYEHFENAA